MPSPKPIIPVSELITRAEKRFYEEFENAPEWVGCAPGRVNLIGEHTDYNEGFVLPMALPLVTVVVGKKNKENVCRVVTTSEEADPPYRVEFDVPTVQQPLSPGEPKWANYVKGILCFFDGPTIGFDAVIMTTVPIGGGLSSSASMEVAFYTFMEAITGHRTSDLKTKALQCQKAEHNYANVPCGVMDQLISVFGAANHALLIDCRSMDVTYVTMPPPDQYVFLIVNSNVHHELSSSEYSNRRSTCQKVASLLNKTSLRDATLLQIEDLLVRKEIDKITFRRARHVVTEIERTTKAALALKNGDYKSLGVLMNASHDSLRDDYEVSCDELDTLVEIARTVPGVLGSRMTGGGFGGCTVSFVKKEVVNDVIKQINQHYKGKATFYIAVPSEGAKIISLLI